MKTLWSRSRRTSPVDPHADSRGPRRSERSKTRGQSLVEFAIGLPCMLLLLLGTIDLGQVFFEYIELRNAVREAASYGARNPYDVAGIEFAVRRHAPGLEEGTTVEVSEVPAGVDVYDEVTITVYAERTFQPLTTAFFERFGIGPITMTASSTAKVWT